MLRRAANGDVTQNLYDEFGGWEGGLGSSQAPTVGYLGSHQKRRDQGTGVVLMGVRGYLPGEGRFLQRDPVDGGSANAYEYASGDPINNLDLDGRRCFIKCGWRNAAKKIGRGADWLRRCFDCILTAIQVGQAFYIGIAGGLLIAGAGIAACVIGGPAGCAAGIPLFITGAGITARSAYGLYRTYKDHRHVFNPNTYRY